MKKELQYHINQGHWKVIPTKHVPGYNTSIHYHGSAKMCQILHLPVARAQGSCKIHMQVFIRYQSARHCFKIRYGKKGYNATLMQIGIDHVSTGHQKLRYQAIHEPDT